MRITVLLWITALWICGQIPGGKAERPFYRNCRMYSVDMSGTNLITLKEFQKSSKTLNLHSTPNEKSSSGLVIIAPEELESFETFLRKSRINFNIVTENTQQKINIVDRKMIKEESRKTFIDLETYNTLEDINKWLFYLKNKYPEKVTIINIGKSLEKRDILGVKLAQCDKNPGIFIEAGIHAREWISPAFALFFINELLSSENYKVIDLAINYNWYIFPVTNPDGYAHSHETDRSWKKTRERFGKCFGVDLNRNWDWLWDRGDRNPCSEEFPGYNPFSDPAVARLAKFIESIKDKLRMYISIHSYGQLILYPTKAKNQKHLKDIADKGAAAFAKRYNSFYRVGDYTINSKTGDSTGWAMGKMNISLAYSLKLRPSDIEGGGYDLPIDQIKHTALETLDAVLEMVQKAGEFGYFPTN